MTSPKTKDVELACRCGRVQGVLRRASPRTVNRCVCYCDDCQAFAHHLGRADLLDGHGGSDVVQAAPADVSFGRGDDAIRGVRLSEKGLFRWFAGCCNTPVGNTLTPAVPFVGLSSSLFPGGADQVSPVRAAVQTKFATTPVTTGETGALAQARMFAHVARLLLGWKLRGKGWPSPFFDMGSLAPRHAVTVLTSTEREALRAKCGPSAARA